MADVCRRRRRCCRRSRNLFFVILRLIHFLHIPVNSNILCRAQLLLSTAAVFDSSGAKDCFFVVAESPFVLPVFVCLHLSYFIFHSNSTQFNSVHSFKRLFCATSWPHHRFSSVSASAEHFPGAGKCNNRTEEE